MSTSQALALATLHNVLGWSRTRFWPKLYLLSDLALYALAERNALLVGESKQLAWFIALHGGRVICLHACCTGAIGGGLLLIGQDEASALGITNIEQNIHWMAENRGFLFCLWITLTHVHILNSQRPAAAIILDSTP